MKKAYIIFALLVLLIVIPVMMGGCHESEKTASFVTKRVEVQVKLLSGAFDTNLVNSSIRIVDDANNQIVTFKFSTERSATFATAPTPASTTEAIGEAGEKIIPSAVDLLIGSGGG